jgi:hypothetical protein
VIRCRYGQRYGWFQAGAISMIGVPWHTIIGDGLHSLSALLLQGCFSTRSPLRHSLARFQNPDSSSLPRSTMAMAAVVYKRPLHRCRWFARAAEVIKNRPRLYGRSAIPTKHPTVPNILHSPFVIHISFFYYLHLQYSYIICLC